MIDAFDGPEIASLGVAIVGLIGSLLGAWFARSANNRAGDVQAKVDRIIIVQNLDPNSRRARRITDV
jgi:hypothetical protein